MNKIYLGFTDDAGRTFSNIRDVHFESLEDLYANRGTLIAESKFIDPYSSSPDIDTLNLGVDIYKSNYDPKVALRIYKDFIDYKYTSCYDQKMISKLQEKQKQVKLTEFPTGVVSIEGKVVGQEIPFYEGYNTLLSTFMDKKLNVLPTHIYIEVLKRIKELYSAGILYIDIHGKNFLINQNNDIKLIDFDDKYLSFDEDMKYNYEMVIGYLKNFLQTFNDLSDIKISKEYEKCDTIDQIYDVIEKENYQLIKKLS